MVSAFEAGAVPLSPSDTRMCPGREQRETDKGYVLVFAPEHPARDIHGYVYEHRLVMEKHLGCPLAPGEVVHHRDKRRWNNNLDNLLLCPDQGIHIALHRAIDSHEDRLVAAYETWLTARAAEGPLRHVATRNPPASEPPPLAPKALRGIAPSRAQVQAEELVSPTPVAMGAVLVLVDRIKEIANKDARRDYLEPLLEAVDRRELLAAMTSEIDRGHDVVAGARLTWTVGVLHIEEAGPLLLRILTSTIREHRRLAWSALAKRKYASIEPQALGDLAHAERGQPLLYAIGAIAKQCSSEQASPILDRIESIEDPGYPRNRLQDALRRARDIARRSDLLLKKNG
jgi:hypothetical protein